jgi:hypothetical protein
MANGTSRFRQNGGSITLSALHHRLGISAEWFLFGCGPMFWDKALAPQGAEVSAAEPFNKELSEMISLMERIPLVRHSIMLYFQKLKIDHQELIQAHLTEAAEET